MRFLALFCLLFLTLAPAFADEPVVIIPSQTPLETIRKLADEGNPSAQNGLAVIYADGTRGVKKDEAEAFKWFKKSAEQGFPSGQGGLAGYYAHGHGVEKNDVEAYFWYSLGAKGGDMASSILVEPAGKKLTAEQVEAVKKRVNEWHPTPAKPATP